MFKKPFQTKTRTPVRSSNCRRLAQEARKDFPAAWEAVAAETQGAADASDAEAHEQITEETKTPVPGKLQTAKFVSHVGDKGEIFYSDAGDPLWVKVELPGSNVAALVPTVYTLWDFPTMLPILWTWKPVIGKLVGGADLMVPGLIVPSDGLPDLKRGTLVAICAPGSMAAQAVGVLAVDTKDIRSVAGAKGKAVLITHTYKDCLWESGSKSDPPKTLQLAESSTLQAGDGDMDASLIGGAADDGSSDEWQVVGQNPNSGSSSGDRDQEREAHAEQAGAVENSTEEPAHETPAQITPVEMDALLMEALKQVMATVLDEKNASSLLPINSSTAYSNYMVHNAPHGVDLDIKKSTYKKLAKFLKAAEKHGLLKLKDIRGESHIKSFDWKHKDMLQYKPYKVSHAKKDKDKGKSAAGSNEDAATAPAAAAELGSQGHKKPEGSQIRVVELFKPPNALKPLFEDAGAQTESGYFSRHETRKILEDYIKNRELVDPKNPKQVKLDHRLCDGLLTKEEYSKLSHFPRDKLQARMLERMSLYTQILIPGREPATTPGNPPMVEITCEKKMGNKVVTKTAGLEKYDIDPNAIAKELRTICASSTAVDPIPGKKGMQSVLVQGHHASAVTRLLEKHGLPPKLVNVTDKTSKPKKK
ncbi:hypothetical protein GGI12_002208 [Dipsacomyces acuminosporus]|nr:hypothetical protein GGI12_002208 [Dipsacomyces acuminosporus]